MNMPNINLPDPSERAVPDPVPARLDPLDASDPLGLVVALLQRLQQRRPAMERWMRYYRGEHPLPWMTSDMRDALSGQDVVSNFTQLVVDGQAERLEVQGFRFLDDSGDRDLWSLWQANDLDAGSQQAHTEALIKGACYALVEPRIDELPVITIEDALGAITIEDPRDRRRRVAGLKCWTDLTGRLVAYLYLPDAVWTFRTEQPLTSGWSDWLQGGAQRLRTLLVPWAPRPADDWPMANPLGVVPLVPILNRPLLDGIGRSEIEPITGNQDTLNRLRAQMIVAAQRVAVPQRYIYGLDVEVDPATGRPKRPFVTAEGRPADLWAIGNPDPDSGDARPAFPPQIGQFAAADVTQYVRLIESEVWQMASISRLPYQELLGQPSSIPQSGEGLKSSEAPLIRKVGKAQVHFGEAWEEIMRVALRAMGDARADERTAETIWQNAETRNEAVRTDSVVKQKAAGIIDDQLAQEQLGYSPEQIARMRERVAEQPTPAPGGPPADEATSLVPAPMGPRMSSVAGQA